MRHLLLPFLLATLLLSGCGSDSPGESVLEALGLSENVDVRTTDDDQPLDPTDMVIDRLTDEGFNGVVLVERSGRLTTHGFGTVDGPNSAAVDQDTVFDIGSITKQFTGAAILRLEADGLLSVDDPLGLHLPEVSGPLADASLHHLLTHTAGLPPAIGSDEEVVDRPEYLERAMAQIGDPGDYRYSNVGYSVLGMVIESVAGTTYEQYLRSRFFDPVGMTATGYVLPDWSRHDVAIGYDGERRLGSPIEQGWGPEGPWWNLKANGGLLSSAADMRRWVRALDDHTVLPATATAKLFGRHVEESDGGGTWYGYGWVSFPYGDEQWFVGHNGGNGIFFADLLHFPDDELTVFVATNTVGADEDVAFLLSGVVLDTNVTDDCRPTVEVSALPTVDELPESVAGRTAAATVDVLLGADATERERFAERHIGEALSDGLPPEQLAEAIAEMQAEFVGYTVNMISIEDDALFHVSLGRDDAQILLSIEIDPDIPEHLTCVHVDHR